MLKWTLLPRFLTVTSNLSDSVQNHNTSIAQQVTSLPQMQTSIAQDQTTSAQNFSVGALDVATIAQGRTSIAQIPQTSDAAALQYCVQNTTSNANPASTTTVTRSLSLPNQNTTATTSASAATNPLPSAAQSMDLSNLLQLFNAAAALKPGASSEILGTQQQMLKLDLSSSGVSAAKGDTKQAQASASDVTMTQELSPAQRNMLGLRLVQTLVSNQLEMPCLLSAQQPPAPQKKNKTVMSMLKERRLQTVEPSWRRQACHCTAPRRHAGVRERSLQRQPTSGSTC